MRVVLGGGVWEGSADQGGSRLLLRRGLGRGGGRAIGGGWTWWERCKCAGRVEVALRSERML